MAYGKCPVCGTAYGKSSKFCKACGHNVTEPAEASTPVGTEPEPKPSDEALLGDALDGLEAGMEAVEGESPCDVREPDVLVAEAPELDEALPAEPARSTGFVVEVLNGLGAGATLEVDADHLVSIGAGDKADLKVPGDDLLSRNHASFFVKDGKVFVQDEGSTNGTLLKVATCKALEEGDVLILGGTVVRINRGG